MNRDDPRRYVVAYDIPDDRRRTRVSKKLESFGDRIQYSVFVLDARPAKLVRLRSELADIITRAEDSILICMLGAVSSCGAESFEFLGLARPITGSGGLVL